MTNEQSCDKLAICKLVIILLQYSWLCTLKIQTMIYMSLLFFIQKWINIFNILDWFLSIQSKYILTVNMICIHSRLTLTLLAQRIYFKHNVYQFLNNFEFLLPTDLSLVQAILKMHWKYSTPDIWLMLRILTAETSNLTEQVLNSMWYPQFDCFGRF